MLDGLRRVVTREPALLVGLVSAAIGLALVFGLPLTDEQVGAIMLFLGAVIALLRFILTPTADVVVQQTPDGKVAGPASDVATGQPVAVSVSPISRAAPPPGGTVSP